MPPGLRGGCYLYLLKIEVLLGVFCRDSDVGAGLVGNDAAERTMPAGLQRGCDLFFLEMEVLLGVFCIDSVVGAGLVGND